MEVEYKDTVYEFPDNTDQEVIMGFIAQNNKEFQETQDDVEYPEYEQSLESGQPLPEVDMSAEKALREKISNHQYYDEGYIKLLGGIESSYNPNAESTSGALGLHQFLGGTWKNVINLSDPEFGKAYDEKKLLEYRRDPQMSAYFADVLTRDNAANMEKRGIKITRDGLYIAHFLGVGEAIKVLKAQPNQDITKVVSERSRKNNPNVFKNVKTTGDLIRWSEGKVREHGEGL